MVGDMNHLPSVPLTQLADFLNLIILLGPINMLP